MLSSDYRNTYCASNIDVFPEQSLTDPMMYLQVSVAALLDNFIRASNDMETEEKVALAIRHCD